MRALMRKFAPAERVDQAAEYATSVHGTRLAGGDQKVATCVSCHHAHGVRRVKDARAPVYPTNVATLCASCHANAEHMKGYTLSGGAACPTSQRDDYQKSVHFDALTRQNDLSAPTCNDCHGNHGATPPGVGAVSKSAAPAMRSSQRNSRRARTARFSIAPASNATAITRC